MLLLTALFFFKQNLNKKCSLVILELFGVWLLAVQVLFLGLFQLETVWYGLAQTGN